MHEKSNKRLANLRVAENGREFNFANMGISIQEAWH
jgi:hypothetical protein